MALWILGAFHTSPTMEIEAIAGLIPIYLHLCMLSDRLQLQTSLLPQNMTSKSQQKIKSSIVNANNHLNGIFPSFDSLNSEFCPDFQLIDIFSSHITFVKADYSSNKSKNSHCKNLINLSLTCYWNCTQFLSSQMPVSKTMLLHLSLMSTQLTILWRRLFITPLTLCLWRQNYLPLDVG